jgi:acyl-CoA synthetase (NDP forming)
LGIATANQLSRLGIGISSFASVGDKLDVSSNDMLMWWEHDGVTRLAAMYIESFGKPRKFARTARRVAASMPVLAVEAGRSEARQRAAASHTAAVAAPLVTREALFQQADVIVVPGFGDLIETAALLATQPVPSGSTVAIVSSIGGAGVLAADACTDLGLTAHQPHEQIRGRLRALIPKGVREFLGQDGHRGWLPPDTTAALLRCYGIPLAALVPVHSEDDAGRCRPSAVRHASCAPPAVFTLNAPAGTAVR